MTSDKGEHLQLLIWFLIIVGPAMAIPGALVFGVIEYICGYLLFSALLLAGVHLAGPASRVFRKSGVRADFKGINPWNYP